MQTKPRHNRQNLDRNRNAYNNAKPITTAPIEQNNISQTNNSTANYKTNHESDTSLNFSYVRNELKWIGIVTGIVMILLVICYFVWR